MSRQGSNSRFRHRLELKQGDLPVVADALQLGTSTAVMYGQEGEGSRTRLRELAGQVDTLRLGRRVRDGGYALHEAWLAARTKGEPELRKAAQSYPRDSVAVEAAWPDLTIAVAKDIPAAAADLAVQRLRGFLADESDLVLELEARDLVIVSDALSLASATAMMYGAAGEKAQERLRTLADALDEAIPVPHRRRGDGYGWHDACVAIRSAAWHEVYAVPGHFRGRMDVWIDVEGRRFRLAEDVAAEDAGESLGSLQEFMDETAGLDCLRLVRIEAEVSLAEGAPYGGPELVAAATQSAASVLDGEVDPFIVRKARRGWTRGCETAEVSIALPGAEARKAADLLAAALPDVGAAPGP